MTQVSARMMAAQFNDESQSFCFQCYVTQQQTITND